ncbi:MAG: hypothetical protein ACYTFK_14480, partial [Planctomycetota bacterium]
KSEIGHLPAEFLEWFEVEVLARWDKFETNPTTIRDWHNRLWTKHDKKVASLAVEQHRAQSDAWKPKFAKVVEIAKGLTRQIDERRKLAEKQADEEAIRSLPPGKNISNTPEQELKEKYEKGTPAIREIIKKLRPEVAEKMQPELQRKR